RLDIRQIEEYEKMASGFPFNRAWYLLFAYRNRKVSSKGRRRTELSHCKSQLEVNRYLSGNTVLWCVVVDISIVSKWKETRKISTKSIVGHLGTKTVDLKCREIHALANGQFKPSLEALGLDQEEYVILRDYARVHVAVDAEKKRQLRFPITGIFPKKEAAWAEKVFRHQRLYMRPKQDEVL